MNCRMLVTHKVNSRSSLSKGTFGCPVPSLVPWRSFAGSSQSYMTPSEFGWSLEGEEYFSLPSRSKLSSEGRRASFSSWQAAGVHTCLSRLSLSLSLFLFSFLSFFFDEWSHYIICLLYSGPPSTFLALAMLGNNGVFVRLAKTLFLQCDPWMKDPAALTSLS